MKRIPLLLASLGLWGAVFILDRWTKILFFNGPTRPVVGTVIQTTTLHNFGLLASTPVPFLIIIALTGTITFIVAIAMIREILLCRPMHALPLALILGGAIGNLFDRFAFGYVFDWILLFTHSVINIADIAIAIGIVWFLFALDQPSKTR